MHMQNNESSFQPLNHDQNRGKNRFTRYLEHIRFKAKLAKESCVFLPSIINLSHLLDCSALEIHEAMSELITNKGHQFLTLGIESPITVCVEAG
jgi:hypothetical protein